MATAAEGGLYVWGAHGGKGLRSLPVSDSDVDNEGHVAYPTKVVFPGLRSPPKFTHVSADMGIFAAVDSAHRLWAWGSERQGLSPDPRILMDGGCRTAEVGATFLVAVTTEGNMLLYGQLGNRRAATETADCKLQPFAEGLPPGSSVAHVAACNNAVCAVLLMEASSAREEG